MIKIATYRRRIDWGKKVIQVIKHDVKLLIIRILHNVLSICRRDAKQ